MEFMILGPLEVRRDGESVEVTGDRQRALLTGLLLRRGLVVPVDQLVDEMFGDRLPRDARNTLQTCVTRLRRFLGREGLVLTRSPGYMLDVPADGVDAERFTALAGRAGRTADPLARLGLLDEALGLWRGPALAGFDFARAEAARLEELRLTAREDRAAALLALGEPGAAVADLDALALAHPWRERAVALLVTALTRAGRVPDALAAYTRHRDALRDELGLDPSSDLRDLHRRVLRGELRPDSRDLRPDTPHGGQGSRVPHGASGSRVPHGASGSRVPHGASGSRVPHGGPGSRLPASPPCERRPDSLIGREGELTAIRRTLAAGRIVTLTGPGGVGKTRLARRIAHDHGEEVFWVDLAPLGDAGALAHTVAAAAGLEAEPGVAVADALGEWAATTRGLLVLDNCEHLLPAVPELLDRMPGAAVLATSRERLGAAGEHVLDVPPLEAGHAAELFRARVPIPGFADEPGQEERIAEICRALDGLPLAVELAAARIGSLTVDDLADRLDGRFALLRRTRPVGRHGALETVIDWSYDMLSAEEQRTFLRLAAFAGPFDLATAEAVAGPYTADLVARLADRSMLTRPGHTGVGRYRMLETLRAYALRRLDAGELRRLRHRHATVMAELAEEAEKRLWGPDEVRWTQTVETWLADMRLAWNWAREAGDHDLTIRIAAALARYGYWAGRGDVTAWGEATVAAATAAAAEHPRLAVVYGAAAFAAWGDGRLAEAAGLARQGVALAAGGLGERARTTLLGGPGSGGTGAAPPVRRGDVVTAVAALGDVALVSGDLGTALDAYRAMEELGAAQESGGQTVRAMAAACQALAHCYSGDADAALEAARRAVALAAESRNPTVIAFARFAEGEVLTDLDPEAAEAALAVARALCEEVGNRFVAGLVLTSTVALRGRHGPAGPALELFHEAIAHWRRVGNRTLIATALRNLVVLFARTGMDEAAVTLAATLRRASPGDSYGAEAERLTRALAAVRSRMGGGRHARAELTGAGRSLEEAADHALAVLDAHAPAALAAHTAGGQEDQHDLGEHQQALDQAVVGRTVDQVRGQRAGVGR
ncbi:putative ATPase/DNA-binding SARP family transcriptional activator [Planomonospora venezuelensis]|uniref:Putative ATPase/DNA-binding SARP family transcriptional activator n=1 Tax=Planomonospora venezuelensis TaxID=1999 RepID=A0A841D513_PLAVE|nr:putative ATPase/DNA-binding SARP family transcriptional activator [Planomonospora venezuelensis]